VTEFDRAIAILMAAADRVADAIYDRRMEVGSLEWEGAVEVPHGLRPAVLHAAQQGESYTYYTDALQAKWSEAIVLYEPPEAV
jgi:hypothetical protein